MNKIKWTLMIAAIILAIGGAILTRPTSKNTEPFYAAESCISLNPDPPATPPLH